MEKKSRRSAPVRGRGTTSPGGGGRGSPRAPAKPRRTAAGRPTLDRSDWISAARDELVSGGIAAVKVGVLAGRLGVTREAFYWHFASLEDLRNELLADWISDNHTRFAAVRGRNGPGSADLSTVSTLLLGLEEFRTGWDLAMRDWARTAPEVAQAVARIDEERTVALEENFRSRGYDDLEARARARIYYLFQVGYYTVRIPDSRKQREALIPAYLKVLLGDR